MAELTVYPQLKWRAPESAALSETEGKRNCGAAGGAALANWGAAQPALVTHHDLRLAAGNPKYADGTPGGLGTVGITAALMRYGADATRHFADDVRLVKEALQAGYAVGICVHYPVINHGWPELSGQLTFRGEHFLVLKGWTFRDKRKGGRNTTTAYDSLFDGRKRNWGTAPLGPQLAPFAAYREAMGEFRVGGVSVGEDLGVFVIVKPAPQGDPPE